MDKLTPEEQMQKSVESIARLILTFLKETLEIHQNPPLTAKDQIESLPLILQARHIEGILGISKSHTYALFKRADFPSIEISGRKMIERDMFFEWIKEQRKK